MEQNHKSFLPKSKTELRKIALLLAVDRALTAQSHNKWLGSKCRNEREKAAWADCLKLYQETIIQLNHNLHHNTKCTDFDTQTWLSTALTHLETSRAGFLELGVADYVLPLMSNNVSKLISNTLALNNISSFVPAETYKEYGFPSWVKQALANIFNNTKPAGGPRWLQQLYDHQGCA